MLKKKTASKLLTIIGLFILAGGVSYSVFMSMTSPEVVAFAEAKRALEDDELPNEQKPTVKDVQEHTHNDDTIPRKLTISKLGIASRIVPLGVSKKGVIQSPANIYDTGWLKNTQKPDAQSGFMVVDGHVQGRSQSGVFSELAAIKIGEGIQIEQGNGKVTSFTVTAIKTVPYDESPEVTVLAPSTSSAFELRIVTCAGTYIKDKKTYEKRLIVTARRQ